MKIIFEGHACFRVISKDTEIMIDPYINGNPQAVKAAAEFAPNMVLVTHGHGDHLGDAVSIARRSGAVIAGQVDLINVIDTQGASAIPFNLGGTIHFGGFDITMVPAWHGSSIKTAAGSIYAGVACGYIISDGEKTLYHAGDTALFGDMSAVISRYEPDCALLPIGDHYTMGPDDAVVAAKWVGAGTVVPMHYNTFPPICQDAEAFCRKLEQETESRGVVLLPGEMLEI